ncbi:hypothetical protein PR001_g12848 [Phytophthora rubi]|uniref:HTH CENPB-type domain-containing protein n=1 Tax=Phytophthora rubi TaxID=129364 RepID=A0A6A3M028_9STRA|nr:hypothetical protein PR001_g12848 [Phytophthora rubi]
MRDRYRQGELCDTWDLNLSDGWLTRFMRRHGLRLRQLRGEAASADSNVVHQGLQSLQEITDLYADIYNMDKTGLCYAMAPARSTCTKGMRGVKKNKTRTTLAMTANADGSHALPILYLGRAKKPRCFHSKKPGLKHILLLLDNASSHSTGDLVLTNVQVRKLPPNTTTYLQPMDTGIIAAFKQRYRRKQLEWVYGKMQRYEDVDKEGIHSRSAACYGLEQRDLARHTEDTHDKQLLPPHRSCL